MLGLRHWVVFGAAWVVPSLVGCRGGHGDEADTADSCGLVGAGEDGPGADCCAGPCCGDACCGGANDGFAPCDSGVQCTSDEECGPGFRCEANECIPLAANALGECESTPALAPTTFGAGTFSNPGALTSIDFDGDGGTDLLIARTDGIAIWQHQGGASFSESGPFGTSSFGRPRGVVVEDINGDALHDVLVLGEGQPGSIARLIGDPEQTFVPQPTIAVGADPARLLVGDVDNDGDGDLVLVSSELSGLDLIHVVLADGTGDFLVPIDVTLSQPPFGAVLAELTGDDNLDLAVANAQGIAVLAGRGTGGFDEVAQLGAGTTAVRGGVAVIDLDDDGTVELVRAADIAGMGELAVWAWSGAPGDPMPTTYTTELGFTAVAAADVDGDGLDDLLGAAQSADGVQPGSAELVVVPSAGDGQLRCHTRFALPKPAVALHSDDFDADGTIDIATASGEDTVTLLLSSG